MQYGLLRSRMIANATIFHISLFIIYMNYIHMVHGTLHFCICASMTREPELPQEKKKKKRSHKFFFTSWYFLFLTVFLFFFIVISHFGGLDKRGNYFKSWWPQPEKKLRLCFCITVCAGYQGYLYKKKKGWWVGTASISNKLYQVKDKKTWGNSTILARRLSRNVALKSVETGFTFR